jgi:predicted Zn finger-like uncharacterized protein
MKITCHSCQSKYNVADEKVQGKTVKIRCKKCGATLVISADGVQANGASAASATAAGEQITFTVNVAEGDQRSMTIEEVVVAYNDGTVTQETYLWADGMSDWLPLAQVESIVAALHSAASAPPPPPPDEPAAYAAPPAYEPPPAYAAPPAFDPAPAPAAEERRAARREGARGTRDLFAAQPAGDDGLSASAASAFAPPPGNGGGNGAGGGAMTTGARNENSVLFSLAVLTKDEAPAPMPMGGPSGSSSARKEDSGLIDLKALSLAAAATSGGGSPELAAPLFAPAAPFGSFDSPALPLGGSIAPNAQPKNKMMLIIAGGAVFVALAAIIALVLVMKSGNKTDATAASASASSAPEVAASASAEPTPSATASAVASSTPADSASATVAITKPKQGVKPPPGAAPPPGVKPPPAAATTAPPAAKPKGGGDCGCNGDLMCLMKCRSGH